LTVKLCFLALVFAFCALLLKSFGWRGTTVFTALGIVILLSEIPMFFKEAVSLSEAWQGLGDSCAAIFKIVGLGYLFGISSDICRELGESGIASALTLVGRLEIIAVSLPFISEIFSLAISLVE